MTLFIIHNNLILLVCLQTVLFSSLSKTLTFFWTYSLQSQPSALLYNIFRIWFRNYFNRTQYLKHFCWTLYFLVNLISSNFILLRQNLEHFLVEYKIRPGFTGFSDYLVGKPLIYSQTEMFHTSQYIILRCNHRWGLATL